MCPRWQKELREKTGIYFKVCLTLNFLLSPSHILQPSSGPMVSIQWVMAFFLMVYDVPFLRLLLPITNLHELLTQEKREYRDCLVADKPLWGGGNIICSMNFLTNFALWEPEEFTEPSAWGQIFHLGHWHSWTDLDDLRLDNCPFSNSKSTCEMEKSLNSIHIHSPTLCESTL